MERMTRPFNRIAMMIDKILKVPSPPIPGRATKEVRVHHQSQAAKQIGLAIPPNVLARADKVIK